MCKKISFTFIFLLFVGIHYGQNFEQLIEAKLRTQLDEGILNEQDILGFEINNSHFSNSTLTHNVYVLQTYQNIPVFNAIGVFAIRNQEVVHFTHRFEKDIVSRIASSQPSISPIQAIQQAAEQLDLSAPSNLAILETRATHQYIFNTGDISYGPIPVQLVYQKDKTTQQLILAWDLSIHAKEADAWWSVRVDAETGVIIDQHNWILSCTQDHEHKTYIPTHTNVAYHQASIGESAYQPSTTLSDGAQYNVYPIPVESPNHGTRSLVVNPADATASPFGWHDTDGVAGAEFTITRGNNVWAQEDRAGNNEVGYAPDGGESLMFDFPLAFDAPPAVYEDAAITNLFYWNNVLHDVWYQYGFDEAAGNFQENNYSGLGQGEDFVFADAQDGAGVNNATFGTPPDGFHPSMTMFLWNPPGPPGSPLSIESPSELEGDINGREAGFGPGLSTSPINADLVLVDDFNSFGLDYIACGNVLNAAAINGKIAVVRRGQCTFVTKVQNAQNAGALAVIVVNNIGGEPTLMGGDGSNITIPSIMIGQTEGEELITALENGTTINVTLANNGPFQLDGDFDNGIISHEFGHGISTRLTGGSSQVGCLFNNEQMGEGWSDYFGLVMTMKSTDVATQGRGYGTFAVSQPTTGVGIRPTPYSTDFSISPFTFNITNNQNLSQPHGIGYVWAQMLWDMTWALIDEYGFDPDLYNGDGGNNIAMQLVVDGLKLQNCSPGFVDGRDAILAADQLANDGANQCIIWQAFADRGLGWSASQGDSDNRFDQVEAFDMPPAEVLDCETFSNETFGTSDFRMWPNPAKDKLHIQLGNESIGQVDISIFSINGKKVASFSKKANQSIDLDISNLKSGVYLIKITSDKTSFTKKLLIN